VTAEAVLARLRAALIAAADSAAAPAMQRYMKSALPYHGVKLPAVRKIARAVLAEVPLPSAAFWRRLVLALWQQATHREERYAALVLTADRRALPFQTMEALPLYERLIVTGAWWDFVDELATHNLGLLLRRHPAEMKRAMRAWSRDDNLWKRRLQGGDRPRAALRVHRAVAVVEGVLPAQGDRLGPAAVCVDGSPGGGAVREGARGAAVGVEPEGSPAECGKEMAGAHHRAR
jgi:hypothetical protein